MVNSKVSRKETVSDDVSAYELIMRNKELLLDRDVSELHFHFVLKCKSEIHSDYPILHAMQNGRK